MTTRSKNNVNRVKTTQKHPTNRMPDISFEKVFSNQHIYYKLSTSQEVSEKNTVAIEKNNDVMLQQMRHNLLKEEKSDDILKQNIRYQLYCRQLDHLYFQDEAINCLLNWEFEIQSTAVT